MLSKSGDIAEYLTRCNFRRPGLCTCVYTISVICNKTDKSYSNFTMHVQAAYCVKVLALCKRQVWKNFCGLIITLFPAKLKKCGNFCALTWLIFADSVKYVCDCGTSTFSHQRSITFVGMDIIEFISRLVLSRINITYYWWKFSFV